tara:strand:- start:5083 stop:5595 length:513 start_codon:yes stop_codon:yes gene_type:complete
MPFHEIQSPGFWCGIHALNNSVQSEEFTRQDAREAAGRVNSQLSDSLKKALNPSERTLVSAVGDLDVTVVEDILKHYGYMPEIVKDVKRALELIDSTTDINGHCLIVNPDSHYVCYRLCYGVWWHHDSLSHAPVRTNKEELRAILHSLGKGSMNNLGRRLIHFFNPLYPV